MKKVFVSLFVVFAMIAMVSCSSNSCSSNPAIEAGEEYIKNPTEENREKFNKSIEGLSEEETEEFMKWVAIQKYEKGNGELLYEE